jgi:hypothetical protein
MNNKIMIGGFIFLILLMTFSAQPENDDILGAYYDHTGQKIMSITKLSSTKLKIAFGVIGPILTLNKQKLESGDPYVIPMIDNMPKDTPPYILEELKNIYSVLRYEAKTCSILNGTYEKDIVALRDVVYDLKASKRVCN